MIYDIEGTGYENDPFQIATKEHLLALTYLVNWRGCEWSSKHFVQVANIYLNDTTNWQDWQDIRFTLCSCCESFELDIWMPIGTRQNPFRGTFNGNGFAIRGLYINGLFADIGFFGVVNGGTIENVTIEQSFIFGGLSNTGAIVGYLQNGSLLYNSRNYAAVNTIGVAIGGLVGRVSNSEVINSVNSGSVMSLSRIPLDKGGIAGSVLGVSMIYGNMNYGAIVFNAFGSTGGIVGRVEGSGVVKNNINNGRIGISPWEYGVFGDIGGIVGVASGFSTITNNSHFGSIEGERCSLVIGGVVGLIRSESVVLDDNWFLSGEGVNEQLCYVGGWDFGYDDWWCCYYDCDCLNWWTPCCYYWYYGCECGGSIVWIGCCCCEDGVCGEYCICVCWFSSCECYDFCHCNYYDGIGTTAGVRTRQWSFGRIF